jgi:Rieske Fe-S protein
MANFQQSRRAFLGALGAAAALTALGRFLLPRRPASRALLTVTRTDLPVRGALVYREARVAIMRDGDAVAALSLVCTHLGCTVTVTPTELVCPCHGSRFNRKGQVLAGPAPRPLPRLRVVERGEMLDIFPDESSNHG